ncbi:membrane protease YdiL (CAAX protease family) [Thermoanaerobacterium butyriciformans]|uniref:Membrane protease YdiL (CAAX protease family) n=2 Tax=Thermoanaerobacterium TaxID=28895 RepID=A0ABS4NGS0_9THEO|nr:membrane protease YdiL (CAAX protease family) [Thermoanaerobacterium butyriciformans]
MVKSIVDKMKRSFGMRPSEKDANKIYLLILVLFVFVGSYVQRKSLYVGLIITEFGIVLLPVVLFLLFKKYDLKYVLRFNKLESKHIFLIILIMICGMFVSSFFSILTNYFLSKFGKIPIPPISAASNIGGLIKQILIVSGSAALCEEILTRGLILRSYEMRGSIKAVVISGLMFAVLHLNVQNFLSVVFLGCLLGFLVHRTDSIYASVLGHFTNNTLVLVIQYVSYNVSKEISPKPGTLVKMNIPFVSVVVYAFIALIAGMFLYILLKKLIKTTNPYIIHSTTTLSDDLRILLQWPILISLLIFLAMIILELLGISGSSYYMKVVKFIF